MFEIGGCEEVWSSIFWAQRRGTPTVPGVTADECDPMRTDCSAIEVRFNPRMNDTRDTETTRKPF